MPKVLKACYDNKIILDQFSYAQEREYNEIEDEDDQPQAKKAKREKTSLLSGMHEEEEDEVLYRVPSL